MGSDRLISRALIGAVIAVAVAVAVAAPRRASAATFHVGKAGCNDAGPGSAQQPWCLLAQAVTRLKPGDTLQVHTGTYAEQVVVTVSGTEQHPIVIEAAAGERPVIDGTSLLFDEQGLLQIDKQRHLMIRGLELLKSPYYCLQASTVASVTVERLKVDTCKHGGIVFDQGSTQIKILNNEVTNTDRCGQACGTHEAITLSNSTDFEVAGNNVHHGVKEGIDAKDGSARGSIHDNTVSFMGQVGIYLNHATAVTVYRNTVHDGGSSGIQLAVGDFATGLPETTNNEIYQNVIYNCKWNALEMWRTRPGEISNNRIYNNVFFANGAAAVELRSATQNVLVNNIIALNKGLITGALYSDNFISNNLFFKNDNDPPDPLATTGDEAVNGDPLLIDPVNGDFRLKPSSPAIDRGLEMGLPAVGRLDIGAFEYQPPHRAAGDGGCAVAAAGDLSAAPEGALNLALLLLLVLVLVLVRSGSRRRGRRREGASPLTG